MIIIIEFKYFFNFLIPFLFLSQWNHRVFLIFRMGVFTEENRLNHHFILILNLFLIFFILFLLFILIISSFLLIFEISSKTFLDYIFLDNFHMNTQHTFPKINFQLLLLFYYFFNFVLIFIRFVNFPNLFIFNFSLFIKPFFIKWALWFERIIGMIWIDSADSLHRLIWVLSIDWIKWLDTYLSFVISKAV